MKLKLSGNPIYENMEESEWRTEVHKRLPNLKKLDGEPIVPDQTFWNQYSNEQMAHKMYSVNGEYHNISVNKYNTD